MKRAKYFYGSASRIDRFKKFFIYPFLEGQKCSDYQLVFDSDAMPKSQDKIDGLFIDKWTQYFKEPGVLDLHGLHFR